MDGILLVDKPLGWTSFDVVAKVRGVLRSSGSTKPKVGHTGTLDPLATGLLVLLVGSYTKRADDFSKLDKTYEATMQLGQTSTTADGEGDITPFSNRQPSAAELNQTIAHFVGQIEQIPPAYSAIKVNGQRAYKLARKGLPPQLKARPVHVYELKLGLYAYPEAKFTAQVSSGTYIRSLVSDMGQRLGTGAYLSSLRRLSVGGFSLDDALGIEDLSAELIAKRLITG